MECELEYGRARAVTRIGQRPRVCAVPASAPAVAPHADEPLLARRPAKQTVTRPQSRASRHHNHATIVTAPPGDRRCTVRSGAPALSAPIYDSFGERSSNDATVESGMRPQCELCP